jgi:hypothetical protein
MSNEDLTKFFYTMYEGFGQFAVIDFVRSRQDNQQLLQVTWKDCDGCDWHTPYLEDSCLVCGASNE